MELNPPAAPAPLVDVRDLAVEFSTSGIPLIRPAWSVRAVQDVSFAIGAGETVGMVGESGSGKSTIGRILLGLTSPTRGRVAFDGHEYAARGRLPRELRSQIQAVFQDPGGSLNPVRTVGDAIGEPVRLHQGLRGAERDRKVAELLELVGLGGSDAHRYPDEFSGGQQQRIAIARALASNARLIVCDEPVAALDVSTQAQVINLFADIQAELGVSYLFIGHDLDVVAHISDRLVVLYRGRIVEEGATERVFGQPAHPYTRMLLDATPVADARRQRARRAARRQAEAATPAAPGAGTAGATDDPTATAGPGCAFRARCPVAIDICRTATPPLLPVPDGGAAACHLVPSGATVPVLTTTKGTSS